MGSESDVIAIGQAPRVAMGEHDWATQQVDDGWVIEQLRAAATTERLAMLDVHVDQEVTIASLKPDPKALAGEPRQGRGEFIRGLVGSVIADPGVKQIAQEKQVRNALRGHGERREKLAQCLRIMRAQVHVRGKERGRWVAQADDWLQANTAGLTYLAGLTSVIDSITTGSTGTSPIGPTLRVLTPLMALTTSMPLTTLPKTA